MRLRPQMFLILGLALALTTTFPNAAAALTQRDFIPIGMEFCMISAENPDQGAAYAHANGFIADARASGTTLFSLPPGIETDVEEGAFMGITVYRQEDGGFAIECGFAAQAVGEFSDDEMASLADRFDLDLRTANGIHAMTRRGPHTIVLAYLSASEGLPCPGDGRIEVAPELLDTWMQVCGRPGLRLQLQSIYSPTELPD